MSGIDILNEIVEIIVGGISAVATGIGTGISDLVSSLFFVTTTGPNGDTTTLSTCAIVLCVFAGMGLALGLCYLVFNWLRSFGK